VCRQCIKSISQQHSVLLTQTRLRPQSTNACPEDAPNPRLRLKKHWTGDARAEYREEPPTESILHMSKTKGSYRLELGEEQKPSSEEPRPLSMRERRQRRREGTLRSSTIRVDPAHLPERVKRKLQDQLESTKSKEVENEVVPSGSSVPQNLEPGDSISSQKFPEPIGTTKKNAQRRSRKEIAAELVEELQPSTPSPPLGSRRKADPILPFIKPELPSSHVKLHFSKLEEFHWYWESFPPTIAQKTQANHFFTNNSKNAKLLRSVAQFRLFPESDVPEVAFVGRSNVGKSSLLNAVVNADIKALLARTSSTPGFTKTMNLYGLGAGNGVTIKKQPNGRDKIVGIGGLTIVDMPGYGEGSLSSWGVEIMKYIRSRKQLRRVFVLLDAQHGIKDKDRSLLASLRLSGVSHQVILSKLDKLYIPNAKDIKRFDGKSARRLTPKGTPEELRKAMQNLKNEIQPPVGGGALGEILGVSAETLVDGKRLGIDHVRFAILKAAGLDQKFKKDVTTPWAEDS
jgi:GTP-binding protein